jgi:nitrogen regulatory protein P-II 2
MALEGGTCMHTDPLKLVTIVAEAVLTESVLATLKRLGATGHTVTEVHGEGSRGLRVGELPGDNHKIEVLVEAPLADEILEFLAAQYFPNYALVAWVSDVVVVRGQKYVRQQSTRK